MSKHIGIAAVFCTACVVMAGMVVVATPPAAMAAKVYKYEHDVRIKGFEDVCRARLKKAGVNPKKCRGTGRMVIKARDKRVKPSVLVGNQSLRAADGVTIGQSARSGNTIRFVTFKQKVFTAPLKYLLQIENIGRVFYDGTRVWIGKNGYHDAYPTVERGYDVSGNGGDDGKSQVQQTMPTGTAYLQLWYRFRVAIGTKFGPIKFNDDVHVNVHACGGITTWFRDTRISIDEGPYCNV